MSRVAIIVVNYNGGALLLQAVQSLADCLHAEDEIILVDNASRDGSAGAVARAHPGVLILRSPENLGFARANNLASRNTRAVYLAFVNPDVVVQSGWLDPLLRALEGDQRIGMATSRVLLLDDPARINTCGNDVHFTGLTLCRGMNRNRDEHSQAGSVNAVSGAAFLIRRELFEKLGGFDDDFFLYMEDADLSLRCRLAGFSCVFVPESNVAHQYRLRFGPNKVFLQERNRYWMLLKCFQWRTLLALSPGLLLAEMVVWGFVLAYAPKSSLEKLRAYSSAVAGWRALMDKRRRVQALRAGPDRDMIARHAHALEFSQAGPGLIGKMAERLFNPVFFIVKKMALTIIRW